ncbi:MAG: replication-associated recombination protein A [Gemmatales bacterium]
MPSLFDDEPPMKKPAKQPAAAAPLAERLRPRTWADFQADESFDRTLLQQLQSGKGRPPSLVLWGPPGTGKTTFAKLIGVTFAMEFVEFSAVLGGVQEIRAIVAEAQKRKEPTLLFVDEIHRFNKSQQDAFLPHVEAGTVVLIGATTENPSFALNGALLSRMRVVVFPSLAPEAQQALMLRAEALLGLKLEPEARQLFVQLAGGDARRLLNWCEAFHHARGASDKPASKDEVSRYLKNAQAPLYDKSGEQHFDTISAFIKSLRGSDPDAALFYGFRMLEAGEDPRFILRRMMIFASEDIGNADPHALPLAVATADAFDRLGLPEGKIPIAQCITYLACAAKSNRSYLAMKAASDASRQQPQITIPLHLRNAPTGLMKTLGYGAEYQYPHDHPEGYVTGVKYLPEELGKVKFYEPSNMGAEKEIAERMAKRRGGKAG